jgi:hypothetical protein
MIGPSGAALSVDRLIRRYWVTRRGLRDKKTVLILPPPEPQVSANLALRLLQVNLCFIYLVSGLSKLQGATWWQGTAIWLTVANYEFSPLRFAPYAAFVRFLCEHRLLWELFMSGSVAFTLFIEIGFPFLVWTRRMRWVMVIGAMLMHTGIALTMGLRTFSMMMIIMDLSFVPPEAVHRLLRWLGGRSPTLRLRFDPRSNRQARVASLVRAADAWDQVELQPALPRPRRSGEPAEMLAEPQALLFTSSSGDVLTGYMLFEKVVRSLRLLWPLAMVTWVPGIPTLSKLWFPAANGTLISAE